jgi:hypothetical protein
MFICDKCFKSSKPGDLCNKLVVETRPQTYTYKTKVGKPPHQTERTKETKGKEIVREIKLCNDCWQKNLSQNE